ncbi:MAG: steroid-binding protein [Firmicutes bacterium]|nr:steroid-binding protein [Bacillota bacterium]
MNLKFNEFSRLNYYRYMEMISVYPWEKNYYRNLYYKEYKKLYFKRFKNNNLKEFTLEELSYYDGSNGRDSYVAVDGIVYDLSLEATWGGGTHFGLYAGKDLTSQFKGCHQDMRSILDKLPKVGVIKE